ncbi:hypothetical protein BDN70DRAFT_872149 [Pholiota conissans]|uniref:Helicase C-terminal domain-containing protein n=1 Tax=Pholiota conissans TaxID=109636 RepID=A0A9P5ZEW7_9AGAR|nr:hypothetical protein BDN70DRAFT_872149 [Pholiota conissans]
MASSWCPSCCGSCFVSSPPASTSDSPFALRHLLALGTILVNLHVAFEHQICDHTHAEDGWHYFKGHSVVPHLSNPTDIELCQKLDYLVQGQFIAATYRSNSIGLMDVRVYLIPYDLANIKGKLRVRKESILNSARMYLRNLLPQISQNTERWMGVTPMGGDISVLMPTKDSATLTDIYSDLESPRAMAVPGYGSIASRLLDPTDDLDGLGMRTKLYTYQRQTVAAMMHKELDLKDVPDPLYIQVKTVDGKPCFLQPGTMEVLQEHPMSANCRGGLLCEELGTGKTIMMISLIVATRRQLSSPEPSLIDDHVVMTPVAYHHFPSSTFTAARKRAGFPHSSLAHDSTNVPSLVELLLHRARTDPYCDVSHNSSQYEQRVMQEDKFNNLQLAQMMHSNVPFYHQYLGEPTNQHRGRRIHQPRTPRAMYLTAATLVVVPANLISQWDREITRHCAIPLRVLILRAKSPMPSVQSLATDYDIILMSYITFSQEAQKQNIMKLHAQQPCKCPKFDGSRVPNCKCKVTDVSPLLQIRWKRLIIDEGHVSSSLSSNLVPFVKILSIERRWIVTGTPTTNLLGLSLGRKAVSEQKSDTLKPNTSQDDPNIIMESPSSVSASSNISSAPPSLTGSTSPQQSAAGITEPDKVRIWNQHDRGDLMKLGHMISHFLAVPQFNADPKLMTSHVIEPLLDSSGPLTGSIQVLKQVMAMVMIRHRIEDVEQDVVLPPVTQESVLLDLDPYVVKSFNALQAIILINAIDSERTHQDYMFHPSNVEMLQLTMKNMSQILFWHVDSGLYNAPELIKNANTTLSRAIERGMPDEDIKGLQEAFKHLQIANEDHLWKSFQNHEDVVYRVYDLNERIFNAWTRTPGKEPGSDLNQAGFLHADRLWKLNKMVVQKPLIKEDSMVAHAQEIVQKDLEFRRLFEESEHRKARGQNKKTKLKSNDATPSTIQTADKVFVDETLPELTKKLEVKMSPSKGQSKLKSKGKNKGKNVDDTASLSSTMDKFTAKASSDATLAEMRKELGAAVARLEREEAEEDGELIPGPLPLPESSNRPSRLVASSLLAQMRIGSSASSKLNYIMNEIQQHSVTEKFLIFSESALSLAHISEALELMHVKFLRFTFQVKPLVREQLVLTFETSETYRVFLMELKHGARGLNLVSASRIIFCEPVWQADVESQAIKRAHRIGQKRPITVKTLAIRQTSEENMVARRNALRNTQEKLPKLLEETGMKRYIENPKFITHPPVLTGINKFPLVDLPLELLQPHPGALMLKIPALPMTSPSLKRVRVMDPITEVNPFIVEEGFSGEELQPTKKQRKGLTIRFATP